MTSDPSASRPGQRQTSPAPDFLRHRLLYRDGLLLIIDKPPRLAVHEGPSGGDHLGNYLDALRFGLPRLPELGHRLDADTSGVLVLGRHAKALRKLGRIFTDNLASKTYWAITRGGPAEDRGEIDLPLHKISSKAKGWRMIVDHREGRPSLTTWQVLGRSESGLCWLALSPLTGRTHQLRIHCAAMGFPIAGDPVYGPDDCLDKSRKADIPPAPSVPRLQLHARRLELPFRQGKPPIVAEAPAPEDMQHALKACGWPLEGAEEPAWLEPDLRQE